MKFSSELRINLDFLSTTVRHWLGNLLIRVRITLNFKWWSGNPKIIRFFANVSISLGHICSLNCLNVCHVLFPNNWCQHRSIRWVASYIWKPPFLLLHTQTCRWGFSFLKVVLWRIIANIHLFEFWWIIFLGDTYHISLFLHSIWYYLEIGTRWINSYKKLQSKIFQYFTGH